MGIGIVFPGQGAQVMGMGYDFYKSLRVSQNVYDLAEEVLGYDIKKLCFEKDERLNLTNYTQPALLTTCLSIYAGIQEATNIEPDLTAGLSLGEYGALTASSVFTIEEAIRIVQKRASLMHEAVPENIGMMAAVLGLDAEQVMRVCEMVSGCVQIGNYNCEGQVVITGEKNSVKEACNELKALGGKCLPLKVSGPFHSPLLNTAGEQFLAYLKDIPLKSMKIPYVSNVTGEIIDTSDDLIPLLAKQIYYPVRWQQSVRTMINKGIDCFIEVGPSKTLSSLIRKIDGTVTVINIAKPEDMEQLMRY